jgi:TolB-like protein/Flp pilus assembly protein TadD
VRFVFDDYALDVARRELRRGADLLPVEPQVFDLLVFLIQNRTRVVSKDDLIQGVWGGRIVSESTLTSRINAVRKAVGDSGEHQRLIRTIPRKGIRFVGDAREETPPSGTFSAKAAPAPEASGEGMDRAQLVSDGAAVRIARRPSIAVLPFANISGDPEQAFFADGMTEEIITGLSRVRWFFVTARTSSFAYKGRSFDVKSAASELGVRYVLQGSLRKDCDRVRIHVQLTDGETGTQLWAQRYDRALSNVFDLQDEITATIVGALEPALGKVERQRARSRKPGNLDAWEVYQHGMSHLYRLTKDDLLAARRFFAQAIAMDPELGMAYSGIAEALYYESVYGFADSIADNREKALAPALRAVALDPEDAGAHCTLGRTHYMRREHAAAIIELTTALDLNPSSALAHYGMGAVLVFSGKPAESVGYLKSAMRLSPYDPNMGSILVRLADAMYFVHDYEAAVDWARKALQQPQFQWSRYAVLLAALGQLGRLNEARLLLDQVKKLRPDFSLSFVQRTHLFEDRGKFEHYLDGLRKVGVMK